MKRQKRSTTEQRAYWLYTHSTLLDLMRYREVGRDLIRDISTERNEEAWKSVISLMKAAGLIAQSTYHRDVHLVKEYKMVRYWIDNNIVPKAIELPNPWATSQ